MNDNKLKNSILDIIMRVTKHKWIIITVLAVVTAVMIYFIKTNLRINNDLTSYMSESNSVRVTYEKYENVFGSSSGVIIALKGKSAFSEKIVKAVYSLTKRIDEVNNEILKRNLKAITGLSKENTVVLFNFLITEMGKSDFKLKNLKKVLTGKSLLASKLGVNYKQGKSRGADPDDVDTDDIDGDGEGIKQIKKQPQTSADPDDEESEQRGVSITNVSEITRYFKKRPGEIKDIYDVFSIQVDKNGLFKSKWIDEIMSYSEIDYATGDFVDKTRFYALFENVPKKHVRLFLAYVLEFYVMSKPKLSNLFSDINNFSKKTGIPKVSAVKIKKDFPYEKFVKLANDPMNLQIKSDDLINLNENGKITRSMLVMLRNRLLNWDFQERLLYSKDRKSTLVIVKFVPNIKNKEIDRVFKFMRPVIESVVNKSGLNKYMAGEPVLLNYMGHGMQKDMSKLLPFVIIIVIISLYLSFRKIKGVLLPLITVLLVVIWTLGLMAITNTPLSIISNILPVVLMAVGTAYGIHIITHFYTDIYHGMDKKNAVRSTMKNIGLAVILAAVTTMAGFSSNVFNEIRPLKEFAIFATVGVFFAFALSVIFINSILRSGGKRKPNNNAERKSHEAKESSVKSTRKVDAFLEWIGKSTYNKRYIYALVFFVVAGIAVLGASKIIPDMDNLRYIDEDTQIRKADKFLNNNFGGTTTLSIVLKVKQSYLKREKARFDKIQKQYSKRLENGGPISEKLKSNYSQAQKRYNKAKVAALNPALLRKITGFKNYLLSPKTYGSENVGKVLSIVDTVKRLNQVFHFGNPAKYKTPATIELTNSYLTSFRSTNTENYLTKDRQKTRILIQIKESSSTFSENFLSSCKKYFDEKINKDIYDVEYTGFTAIKVELNSIVIKGQAISLVFSLLLVFLIISFSYKRISAAIIAVIPLGMTVLFNFGVMGFAGIRLDAPTSVIGSIAIGIGIDDTIHYIHTYLRELKKSDNLLDVTVRATRMSGRAIVFTTLSITLGFSVLMFSIFKPMYNLGLLVFITMWIATFCSITVIPAFLNIIYTFKKKRKRS